MLLFYAVYNINEKCAFEQNLSMPRRCKKDVFFLLKVWVKLIWLFLSYLRVPQINSSPKEKKKKDCSFCFCFARCPNPRAWREKASKTMQFAKREVYLYIHIYFIFIYIYIIYIYIIFIYTRARAFCRNQHSGAGSEKALSRGCYPDV